MDALNVVREIDKLQRLAIDRHVSEDSRRDAIEQLECWEDQIRKWAIAVRFQH
jgi:hypothetical protein